MRPARRTVALAVGGRPVELAIRRSGRARHIAIRVDSASGGAELVLPLRVSESEGIEFVHSRAAWLLRQLDELPPRVPFRDGAVILFRGQSHAIAHDPAARRGVWVEDGRIVVSGQAEHLPRRLHDWLRREARAAITPLASAKAEILEARPGRISIRDQKSRWGSCAPGGNLSFNWRLILAPDWVLDYVVAHEVGHIAKPNHSPAFWATVDRLTPHASAGRAWLRKNGDILFGYG